MKNLKKLPTYIIYSVLFSIFVTTPVSASESITTNVSVEPSLTLSLSASSLALNLDPSITTFGYKDLDVIVGTNNATGYKLTMSTTSGNTNLVNTEDNTKVIETLPTLAGGYTDSTFIANKWGYKKNRNTDNYNSFPATQTLLENNERTNEDIANLRFGTKIDYLQESGTYATNIEFNLVANPEIYNMQDFTKDMCSALALSRDVTLTDIRDGNKYTARYINGNCWMTSNLIFVGTSLEPISTNVKTAKTISYNNANYRSGPAAWSGVDYNGNPTVWYNYQAAAVKIGYTVVEATEDICPSGWRLPTYDECGTVIDYANEYKPVGGGHYANGALYYPGPTYNKAGWWSSSYGGTGGGGYYRYTLNTNDGILTNGGKSYMYVHGFYIRCIAK